MVSISQGLLAFTALAGLAAAHPSKRFTDPTDNGFPNPNATGLAAINQEAGGQQGNAPPPPKLNASSIAAFQLIAFNELFEVAYFTSLRYNVSTEVCGYETDDKERLVSILDTIIAQEELHAINALTVVTHFNASLIPSPCEYTFPVSTLPDAIALAETFTSVVLGTLQDAEQLLATNGDVGPTRPVASVIGQEGEQNGFFRYILNRKPSQKPFLTTNAAPFAYSALQGFVKSCPFDVTKIPIPIFPGLSIDGAGDVSPKDQQLHFTADLSKSANAGPYIGKDGTDLFVTYFIGQNIVSEPISNVKWSGSVITFDALFPYAENVADGLTIASLTFADKFASVDDVPPKTLAAPGLIQVNQLIAL